MKDRLPPLLGVMLVLCVSPGPSAEEADAPSYPEVGREVVQIVREHFLDAERAAAWADRHADYAADADDPRTFARRTNDALAELKTSHTAYYPRGSAGYWGLLAIFADYLEVGTVEYDSIGIDVNERHFVRRVLVGGPAEAAGVLRGDRILRVDGRPFEPLDPFSGKAGVPVEITIERKAAETRSLSVTPRRINPKQEWLQAQLEGVRMISRDDTDIAYIPMLWCVGDAVAEQMREWIAVRFVDADAMILDFRDGWGGCNSDFMNYFNVTPPVLTLIDREGEHRTYDPQWRKPLQVLINGGTRSGKEVIAYAVQEHGIGTLVGEPTPGFVVGGRPYLLSDGSVLYLAVLDALVDGKRLEGVGVKPDLLVLDRLEYVAGGDRQLERAVDNALELRATD